jgi:hypothetical protein
MNYRLLALAIAALSSAHITTAAAQSVYVAPGAVYIGGGPVYVNPAPSNGYGYGNGYYSNAYYGNGYGNGYYSNAYYGNGYGNGYYSNGYGNGYGYGPPPAVVIARVGARGVGVRPDTPANRGGPVNRVGRR